MEERFYKDLPLEDRVLVLERIVMHMKDALSHLLTGAQENFTDHSWLTPVVCSLGEIDHYRPGDRSFNEMELAQILANRLLPSFRTSLLVQDSSYLQVLYLSRPGGEGYYVVRKASSNYFVELADHAPKTFTLEERTKAPFNRASDAVWALASDLAKRGAK